jgi:hypothetical protein
MISNRGKAVIKGRAFTLPVESPVRWVIKCFMHYSQYKAFDSVGAQEMTPSPWSKIIKKDTIEWLQKRL